MSVGAGGGEHRPTPAPTPTPAPSAAHSFGGLAAGLKLWLQVGRFWASVNEENLLLGVTGLRKMGGGWRGWAMHLTVTRLP